LQARTTAPPARCGGLLRSKAFDSMSSARCHERLKLSVLRRISHLPDAPAVNCVARRRPCLWQHASVFKARCPAMRASKEISIDLTAEDLLSQLTRPPAKVAHSLPRTTETPWKSS
jgi:hypothetical protein